MQKKTYLNVDPLFKSMSHLNLTDFLQTLRSFSAILTTQRFVSRLKEIRKMNKDMLCNLVL